MTRATIRFTAYVEIEYDPAFFTEEWMSEYRKHFHGFREITDHLEHVVQYVTRFHGTELPYLPVFIEGYGYVKINGSYGHFDYVAEDGETHRAEYDDLPELVKKEVELESLCPAINIIGGGWCDTEPV